MRDVEGAESALARGMTAQLERWRGRLAAGEERLGWKIALNVPAVQERLGLSSPAIGYLTSAARLASGASHSLAGGTRVGVEPEIAVELARDVPPGAEEEVAQEAIATLCPAIEVVDIDLPFEDLAAILEANVFQRAVAFCDHQTIPDAGIPDEVLVRVERNGREEVAGPRPAGREVVDAVRLVAELLGRFGERLRAGDRIIAGSLTEALWVEPGDRVTAEILPLGSVSLAFVD